MNIVLIFSAILILCCICMVFAGLNKFDKPIKEANEQKEKYEAENNKLNEKWNQKNLTGDSKQNAEMQYRKFIKELDEYYFFNSFQYYLYKKMHLAKNRKEKISPIFTNVKHLWPLSVSKRTNEKNEIEFFYVMYIEYTYGNMQDKIESGYFDVVILPFPPKITNISFDELKKYNLDIEKIDKIKEQYFAMIKDTSVKDIVEEWKSDSATINSNKFTMTNLDKDIKSLKNAKTAAIVTGVAAGAAIWNATNKTKRKKV